jgi:hypothetical protein
MQITLGEDSLMAMQIILALDIVAPMKISVFPEGLALMPFSILLFFEWAQN